MQPSEFAALAAVEQNHWFYRGKRRIVRHWLGRLAVQPDDLIVDVGAGTGLLLGELEQFYRVLGVEYSADGLHFARQNTTAPLLSGLGEALPLATDQASVVIALDVLEHIEHDRRVLLEMARVVHPGGWLIINVPAFASLWSKWDESLGHWRRYTATSLQHLVEQAGLRIEHMAYTNWLAFPPIMLYRAWYRHFGKDTQRLEDGVPGVILNTLLEAAFVQPACWPWFHPPFGVSLFCILQKI